MLGLKLGNYIDIDIFKVQSEHQFGKLVGKKKHVNIFQIILRSYVLVQKGDNSGKNWCGLWFVVHVKLCKLL